MPIDFHEISFGHAHSLTNSRKKREEHRRHLNLFANKKVQKQSDFLGNEYVFRGVRCTGKNVF